MNIAHSEAPEQAVRPDWERIYSKRLKSSLDEISGVLNIDFRTNPFRPLRRRFVLAHAPRVGSHLLREHLREYGALVGEYFELRHMLPIARRNGFIAVEEFCTWLVDKFALDGVFGVSGGVRALAPLVAAGEIPDYISDWRFVHLTREDFVARAVSEFIARETHAFTSTSTPAKVLGDDEYDAAKLRQMIETTLKINAAWEGAFTTHGIKPYRLNYEALCADAAGETAKVACYLQLELPRVKDRRLVPPKLEKQATSVNERWAARFRAENAEFCEAKSARA